MSAQTTARKAAAMRAVLAVVLEAVKAAGPQGAPAGPMYAALMAQGCTLDQFQAIMGALVKTGKVRASANGELYTFIADL